MNSFLFYLVAFVVVLGVLIVVHELGHYFAARVCGVKVLRFSVGFGSSLWEKRLGRDQTEWAISLFPLGGYVKMLDEREGVVDANERHRAFNCQGVAKRSLIVAAGPISNLLLATLLYWGLFMFGGQELLPILGAPPSGTPAATASVSNGEQVRSVDGQSVTTWSEFRWVLLQRVANRESVELELVNERNEIVLRRLYLTSVGEQSWEGDALDLLGIRFYRPEMPPLIGNVVAKSPGERAGLKSGDRVLSVAGKEVSSWYDFVTEIRSSPDRSVSLELERQGEIVAVNLIPDAVSERGKTVGKIGVAVAEPTTPARQITTFVSYGFFAAAGKAVGETWDQSIFSLQMMGKMLLGQVSWKNISGPVTIADYAGQSARLGLGYYLKFMALVSISLGVLNLLPIPVLDGGHLLYHIIEVIRRRPLSERAMEVGQRLGMSVLFALMAFAFFNDLTRLFNG